MYKETEKNPDLPKKMDNMTEKYGFRMNVKFYYKECMAMKKFLTHEHSLDSYELYHIHVKKYKKCVYKTKNIYQKIS